MILFGLIQRACDLHNTLGCSQWTSLSSHPKGRASRSFKRHGQMHLVHTWHNIIKQLHDALRS